jgi:hypothetical protein
MNSVLETLALVPFRSFPPKGQSIPEQTQIAVKDLRDWFPRAGYEIPAFLATSDEADQRDIDGQGLEARLVAPGTKQGRGRRAKDWPSAERIASRIRADQPKMPMKQLAGEVFQEAQASIPDKEDIPAEATMCTWLSKHMNQRPPDH